MKKCYFLLLLLLPHLGWGQSAEIEQLLLNVEKLAQFKQILEDMKKGYEVLSSGYNTIRDLSQGNFSLHQTFLDGLLQVNPQVRKYHRITGIIEGEIRLVKVYKKAWSSLSKSDLLRADELDYLSRIYERLLSESLAKISELTTVLTAGTLRMSDEERLAAIDQIDGDMQEKLRFLNAFNAQNTLLLFQRKKAQQSTKSIKNFYGIN